MIGHFLSSSHTVIDDDHLGLSVIDEHLGLDVPDDDHLGLNVDDDHLGLSFCVMVGVSPASCSKTFQPSLPKILATALGWSQ